MSETVALGASCRAGLVSVIIPTYNRRDYLAEAVASVAAQTYAQWECILVDDGSTDDTAECAQGWIAHYGADRVRYEPQSNAGAWAARNRGLAVARGEYIQYLDSDDLLDPRKFELQIEQLLQCPGAGLSYCTTTRFTDRPDPNGRASAQTGRPIEILLPSLLKRRWWHTLSPLWRRQACQKIGPWHRFAHHEDWEYDCRAGIAGVHACHCEQGLAYVRDHDQKLSAGWADAATILADIEGTAASVWKHIEAAGLVAGVNARPIARHFFTAGRGFLALGRSVDGWRCLRRASRLGSPALRAQVGTLLAACRLWSPVEAVAAAERIRGFVKPGS